MCLEMMWIRIFSWERSFSFVLQSSGQWQPCQVPLSTGTPWLLLQEVTPAGSHGQSSWSVSRCFFLTSSADQLCAEFLVWLVFYCGSWRLHSVLCDAQRVSLSPRSSPFPATILQITLCGKFIFLFNDSPVIGITWSLSAQMSEVL